MIGNVLPFDIDFFMSHGANQVLLKPVNLTDLEIAINSLTDIR